jgi:repressor LexA
MGKDVEMEDVSATNIVRYTTTKQVPLLGEIAAGEPILACEDCKTYIEVDGSLQVDFCLRVNGDSMIDARICDGDLVFVRRQPVVENGEIAVVLLDNEATLKRFYRNDGGVILKPENAKYQPRFYTERDFKQVRVLGKAVMFQSLL